MFKKYILFICVIAFALPILAQQPDLSLIPYRSGDKWGYSTPDKIVVIKPIYDEANWFVEGFAAVKKGGKYGYINKAGRTVIPFKFFNAKPFRYGYITRDIKQTGSDVSSTGNVFKQDTVLFAGASLKADGSEVCINTKGVVMRGCPAINENSVADNNKVVSVTTEKVYTLVNNGGLYDKLVDDYKIKGSDDTYYIGVKNSQYGVINNKFEVIVPFEYSLIKPMNIGDNVYLQGEKNGMQGMFNANGSVYIPMENKNLVYVKAKDGNGYFINNRNGKAGIRNFGYTSDIVVPAYSEIVYDDEGGFVLTGENNMKGYYFLDNRILEPKYSDIRMLRGGKYLMIKTPGGKTGYVSVDGKEYFIDR